LTMRGEGKEGEEMGAPKKKKKRVPVASGSVKKTVALIFRVIKGREEGIFIRKRKEKGEGKKGVHSEKKGYPEEGRKKRGQQLPINPGGILPRVKKGGGETAIRADEEKEEGTGARVKKKEEKRKSPVHWICGREKKIFIRF